MRRTWMRKRPCHIFCFVITTWLASAAAAMAQPSFTKAFLADTIGPGSVSTLSFTITNGAGVPASSLSFTDVLPAAVLIDAVPAATTTCSGAPTLTAPAGGGTITFDGGALGGFSSCTVSVNVTSSVVGTHNNVSGDLTSSAGNSGTATADLIVTAGRPGFSKSFAPSTVGLGGRSTLTFTIDNSANPSFASPLLFTDNLPAGMVVADPANAVTTCLAGTVTAIPGSGVITHGGGSMTAGATCTVTVDVKGNGIGQLDNISGDLETAAGGTPLPSGKASASLTVLAGDVTLIKDFPDDPVNPGDTVTLTFTILNRDRDLAATGIAFTDDLDATLSGLTAIGLPASDVCGPGSLLTGVSTLALSGGSLPPEGSCTFSVTLQVPAAAAAGGYPNVTSAITADLGGSPLVGAPAAETLYVNDAPSLTKTFLSDPVGPGGSVTVELTITNNSTSSPASDISFTDNLDAFFSGLTIDALPAVGFCGAGSFVAPVVIFGELTLQVFGASLPTGGSCTFQVDLGIPVGAPPGLYVNTTGAISATVDGVTQIGAPASATLTVVGAPTITKQFLDPVQPGDTVTLEFTISHGELAGADATGIMFSDDLTAVLAGLTATDLPQMNICGAGSMLSGTTNLSFTGGSLAVGTSCTFSTVLQVPAAALPGSYPNNTSNLVSTVGGLAVTSFAAADTLDITGLSLSKDFVDDPAIPGQTVTLEFTITNSSTVDATDISFNDNLDAALSGLTATALPPNGSCGGGSVMIGISTLSFFGGSLPAGTSCTLPVSVLVPAAAADGIYLNLTTPLIATVSGSTVVLDAATAPLVVSSDLLLLTKTFTDDPVAPGSVVDLEFTLTNLDPAQDAVNITFTDDLAAALSGLVAIGLPQMNVCGAGSMLTGAGTVTLSGGNLLAGTSCTFNVSVMVPAAVPLGTTATNVTSAVSGEIGGLAVTGLPASDDLLIDFLTFSKAFDGPSVAGGTPTLTFTIENLSATDTIGDLAFTDDLDAVLSGLVATGLPLVDVCGTGSMISGTSFLTFSGGTLLPGGSCSVMVPLQVPAAAAPGSYPNTSSELFQAGLPAASPATATLGIEPPPTFAKAFAPAFIGVGGVSTLTFTIDNSASTLTASALDFTDNLPAGVVIAATPAAATTCVGGALTAAAGSGVFAYTGGVVPAGAGCIVQVDVTGTVAGAQVNTSGDLTSSSGNSGAASDTLTVNPQPAFSKVFAPDSIPIGGLSTLTFTIDNTGSTVAATGLAFTDNLPAAVVVATPANGAFTCSGGTLTAVDGSGTIAYTGGTVAAGSSCTLSVDVTASVVGLHANVSGALTSSLGSSGTASDSLTVNPPPTFAKAFAPDPILVGGISTLTFTIDNAASEIAASGLDFTDNLPAGLAVATPANASTTCTGGTVTAAAGSGTIAYTGGSVAAAGSCTVQADVTGNVAGTHVNLSGALTSSLGSSGTASDSLTVDPPPAFAKAFAPASILSGEISTLTFTIDNTASTVAASGLDFTDNLPAAVVIATPANGAFTCTGGTLTAADGSGTIAYTGGSVAAGASCTVSVEVTSNVPATHVNLSGALTSSSGSSGTATDSLTVGVAPPAFSKLFVPDLIKPGDLSVLTFTIDNAVNTVAVANLDFTDDLPAAVVIATPSNAATTCAGGTLSAPDGGATVTYTGGTVAASASCTVSVEVTSSTVGSHLNTSGPLTSDAGSSGTASATLTVIDAIVFTKALVVNPVLPGGFVDLEYTISNASPTTDLTDIAFSDDLDAALSGLAAVGLPAADVCGAGSQLSGSSTVALTGGSLAAGASCTFAATLQLPADPAVGFYPSVSGPLTATAGGVGVASGTAAADLEVVFLGFAKTFGDQAVIGGDVATLTFTISNPDPVNSAAGIAFADDLDAVIPGLAAVGLPAADVCGLGSLLDGTTVITLTGGLLGAGETCVFAVTVQVPEDAPSGTFVNVTSALSAVIGGLAVDGDPAGAAEAPIEVIANALEIPTLGAWGLLLLAAALMLLALRALRPARR